MVRRKEREFALKVLYAVEFNNIPIEEQTNYLKQSEAEFATDFALSLISIYSEKKEDLDKLIKEKLKHWRFERVAVIDRILIRLALVEFLYLEDIPPKVTMDEMIEIGKMYSTDKSNQFINGMLNAILKSLQAEKKIKKSGRGLVN